MENRYAIDVEVDVLRERISNLEYNYSEYLDNNNIDYITDSQNPIVIKYTETIILMNSAYNLKTYEEIDDKKKKLEELWAYYDGLL